MTQIIYNKWEEVEFHIGQLSNGSDVTIEMVDGTFIVKNEDRPKMPIECSLYHRRQYALDDVFFDFKHGVSTKVWLRPQIGGGCLLSSDVHKPSFLDAVGLPDAKVSFTTFQ